MIFANYGVTYPIPPRSRFSTTSGLSPMHVRLGIPERLLAEP